MCHISVMVSLAEYDPEKYLNSLNEGCYWHFWPSNKMRIFTISISMRSNQSKKNCFDNFFHSSKTRFLNASTSSYCDKNCWPLITFLMCGNKKLLWVPGVRTAQRMTQQFDVLGVQKGAGLNQCVRAHIVMVDNDTSSPDRFSNFSEDFRQTNCGVPLRIDCTVEVIIHVESCKK